MWSVAKVIQEEQMKLYYLPGASSLLPHIVLVEAGLPFEAVKVDEHTKALQGGGDYRAVNPLGYVPALQLDDGTILTEAAAIAQYVADSVPAMGLAPPNGTLDRVKLQSWLNFISSEVQLGCFCPLLDRKIPEPSRTSFANGSTAASLTCNNIWLTRLICSATTIRSPMCICSLSRIGLGLSVLICPLIQRVGASQARRCASRGARCDETRTLTSYSGNARNCCTRWLGALGAPRGRCFYLSR
jgi:hypothetical protein